jgi:hypothetical protein
MRQCIAGRENNMTRQRDFLDILREVRGSAAPGKPLTDGIWYELTVADTNGNPGIYGDILAKYGIITESAGTFDQAVAILENLNVEVTTLPAGSDATSSLVNGVWQIGIPQGTNGTDGDDGFTPEVAILYDSGNLKCTVTVDGVVVTNTNLLNLDALVDSKVSTNVGVQETLEAKQDVLDAVATAQGISNSFDATVVTKKQEIATYTNTKIDEIDAQAELEKTELGTHSTAKVGEYNANALSKLNQYNDNHTDKLSSYNINDSLKMDQYNENHIERLSEINYAYADRIVEMIKTRNFMGILDEYVAKTATHMITFLDTTDANYIYYANGTLLTENVDYTVYDSKTIELTVKTNPYDVIVQVNTQVLNDMLTAEGALFDDRIGQPNGLAGLDESGKVTAEQLPSYVDDVVEVATYADLPVSGETGKIYVVVADETSGGDTSSYRWTGSIYAMVSNTLNASDVKSLYEANADTNVYSDAEKAKLDTLETSAQLDSRDIANRYRNNHTGTQLASTISDFDTAVGDSTQVTLNTTKLAGIEDGATADQTANEIEGLYEGLTNTNKYTDAEKLLVDVATVLATTATTLPTAVNEVHDELDIVEGRVTALESETTDLAVANRTANTLDVTSSDGTDATLPEVTDTEAGLLTSADKIKLDTIETNAKDDQTAEEIKTAYESNADTNALTDALLTLLTTNKVKNVVTNALNNRLVITYTDSTTSELNINDIITDVHVSGATLDATTNVLTLTSADGVAEVTVDLSDFVNSGELASALDNHYTKNESNTNFEPKNANIQSHISSTANPHGVTKAQVGLGNVDNTSDTDKPISTAGQVALNSKADKTTTYTKVEVVEILADRLDPRAQYTSFYGLNWDQTADEYTRTGASNYTAIQSMMKRCVLNADGSVNYYLDPFDSTKKTDGTAANLDGTDGNVMVEVPKFYYGYNYLTTGNTIHSHSVSLNSSDGYPVHWAFVKDGVEVDYRYYPAYLGHNDGGVLKSISGVYPTTSISRTTARTYAEANGTGWHQIDFALYEAITLLMIIEYGTMNIQSALGQGRTALSGGSWTGGSFIGINGLSNSDGNGTNNVTYTGNANDAAADGSYMTYRGCENFFGNVWKWLDGININERKYHLSNSPATFDDTSLTTNGYTDSGVTGGSANGYARELANTSKGFIPVSVSGGSSSTGTTDYYYSNTGLRAAIVGGAAASGLLAGPLYLYGAIAAATVGAHVGAGVSR